jgi:hypothetical protein
MSGYTKRAHLVPHFGKTVDTIEMIDVIRADSTELAETPEVRGESGLQSHDP